ncbi:MAG: class I SAM-dependent methyltransferase [Halanaerobiales bacterium]
MSREYFNQMADGWDEMVEHDSDIIRNTVRKWPDLKHPRILDVGTGTGVMIPFLREKFGDKSEIIAIDFAGNMIKKAREKFTGENINFVHGNILEYPFENKYFDIIICYSVFPHFKDKMQILKKLHNLLKYKGLLVIFHSDSREKINQIHHKAGTDVREDRLPPAEKIMKMAENLGFKVENMVDNYQKYLIELIKD